MSCYCLDVVSDGELPGTSGANSQKPPPGYLGGSGRGIKAPAGSVVREFMDAQKRQLEDDNEDLSESRFDKFAGYAGSLFANTEYDQEDEEADAIYGLIDSHIDKRRRLRREAREAELREKYREQNVKLQQQFSDLKPGLAKISAVRFCSLALRRGIRASLMYCDTDYCLSGRMDEHTRPWRSDAQG